MVQLIASYGNRGAKAIKKSLFVFSEFDSRRPNITPLTPDSCLSPGPSNSIKSPLRNPRENTPVTATGMSSHFLEDNFILQKCTGLSASEMRRSQIIFKSNLQDKQMDLVWICACEVWSSQAFSNNQSKWFIFIIFIILCVVGRIQVWEQFRLLRCQNLTGQIVMLYMGLIQGLLNAQETSETRKIDILIFWIGKLVCWKGMTRLAKVLLTWSPCMVTTPLLQCWGHNYLVAFRSQMSQSSLLARGWGNCILGFG